MTPIQDRRAFLFGLGAMVIALPKLILSNLPVLYGDGEHDDTESLSALLSGSPVRLLSGDTLAPGRRIKLKGGRYLISDTVRVGGQGRIFIDDLHVITSPDFRRHGPSLEFLAGVQVDRLHLDNRRRLPGHGVSFNVDILDILT